MSKQRALVIAEKPSLMKKIQSAYDNHKAEFDFEMDGIAQVGHLFGLKLPNELDETMKGFSLDLYPWFPHHWEYKITDDKSFKTSKSDIFYKIKDAIHSGKYDFIIHAGDPDQEGELLVRETLTEAGNTLPVKRLWINASTEEEFVDGLKNMRDDSEPFFEQMYQSALARQHSDYLIGMNFSPIVMTKTREVAHVGRLKSFIVSRICQREEEVVNWKPSSTYGIGATYKEGFIGTHTEYFETEEKAREMFSLLKNTATVVECETKRTKQYAPPLFKLSSLQIATSKKGINADETQDIAQKLYDKEYLSYPRTSCEYINDMADFKAMLRSASVFPDLKEIADKITDADIENIKKNNRYVRNKETAESGHQALTPTTRIPNLSSLSEKEKTVLYMVFAEFIAIFMPPLVQDKTKIVTDNNGYEFVTNGKVLVEKGYTTLLTTEIEDKPIPVVKKGDVVNVDKLDVVEKKATKPKRYTDGTLIEALEHPAKYLEDNRLREVGKIIDISIGQPSTRAPILKQLITLGYLEHTSGKVEYLVPTEKGKQISKNLEGNDLCKADTTAIWEEKLEKIRKGEKSREEFENEIHTFVIDGVQALKMKEMVCSKKEGANVIGQCPKCNADYIKGKFGYYCSAKCGFQLKKFRGKTLTDAQIKKVIEGKSIDVKGLKSKAGKEYGMKLIPTKNFSSFEYEGKTYYSMDFETEFLN